MLPVRDVNSALSWLEQQRASGSTAWHNLCESLCRQAYGLPAHYSSAGLHADAIPAANRYGQAQPRRGDLVLYKNSGAGHIVVATGNGWQAYTNDYGGKGRVTLADARDLARWCNASTWFVADAWWSSTNKLNTHTTSTGDDDMATPAENAHAVWNRLNADPVTGTDISMASIVLSARIDSHTALEQIAALAAKVDELEANQA